MTRHSLWIGDLLRAYETLDASTPERRAEIARSLGLGPPPAASPEPALSTSGEPIDPEPAPPETPEPPASRSAGATPDRPDRRDPEPASPIAVVGYDPPLVTVHDGPALGTDDGDAPAPSPYLSLLRPRSTRAVLQALLAQPVEGGDVDVAVLVRAVATRRVGVLPRRQLPTLRFGVQVLVDNGKGMAPFTADQDDLVDQIRDVVGPSRTKVLYFAGSPLRGAGPGPVWTWERYRPPPPGTPVLILSDLNLIPRWEPAAAGPGDWPAFARLLRAAGVSATALVPYPSKRWPGWVRRSFTTVVWDRALTVGRAKAVRR